VPYDITANTTTKMSTTNGVETCDRRVCLRSCALLGEYGFESIVPFHLQVLSVSVLSGGRLCHLLKIGTTQVAMTTE
jgi:hypothetical protein